MKNGLMTRQEAALERLAEAIGAKQTDGEVLLKRLRIIERIANDEALQYCNGDITGEAWEKYAEQRKHNVESAFGVDAVPGLFINGDARGYSLKINNEDPKGLALIRASQLRTDWGGYGILAPEDN